MKDGVLTLALSTYSKANSSLMFFSFFSAYNFCCCVNI
jgi:hypothetical protein